MLLCTYYVGVKLYYVGVKLQQPQSSTIVHVCAVPGGLQADPGFGPATLGGPCRDAKTLKLIEGRE